MSVPVIALLRVIHIAFGAFWLGGAVTLGFFVLPMVKVSSPIDGQFVTQLIARTRLPTLLTVMTIAGAIATLAGVTLYTVIWAGTGFSGPARWYAIGGHIAIVVVILAGAVVVPAAHKLGGISRTLAGQEYPPTARQNAERKRLMNRITWATQLSAVLLIITVALMAIGRYV